MSTSDVSRPLREQHLLRMDKLVEAYVAWREMCARVDDAYRSPLGGPARGVDPIPRRWQRVLFRAWPGSIVWKSGSGIQINL